MEYKKNFLSFFCLINLCSLLSAGFLYGESEGSFENYFRLSARIYFKESSGIFLYAIDSNKNQLLMKIEYRFADSYYLTINFNGKIIKMGRNKDLFSEENSKNMLRVKLEIKYNSLYQIINHNNVSKMQLLLSDVFAFTRSDSDLLDGYPLPKNYRTYKNKIFIWIGNIGPYNGFNNVVYQPIADQLIGCLYFLRISNQKVQFTVFGDDFLPSCTKSFNETTCKVGKCTTKEKPFDILDCSLSSVNVKKYCFKDLSTYSDQRHSYLANNRHQEFYNLKLVWKQFSSKIYCLMEIHFWNESSVSFLTNRFNDIIMCTKWNRSSDCSIRILDKISLNMIHVLLINYEYPDATIRVSDGDNVKTFIQPFPEYPTHVNIGFMAYTNESFDFEGNIGFLYEESQFKLWKKEIKDEKSYFYQLTLWLLIPGGIIIVLISILIIIISIKSCKKPSPKRCAVSNIYEESFTFGSEEPPEPPERDSTYACMADTKL